MDVPTGAAPRRAAGGGEDWYEDAWQFATVETMLLLVLILIATLFDTFWHSLSHFVERNTYRFGHAHHRQGRNLGEARAAPPVDHEHKQLYTVLLQRMGSEFMTLGMLALLTFICEKYGGFDSLADALGASMGALKLPRTGLDWFHMAETVHFTLFGGMCLYHIQMIAFVSGSIKRIKGWEQERERQEGLLRSGSFVERQVSDPSFFGGLTDPVEYQCMQDRFIDGVFSWKVRGNAKYTTLLWHLGLDPDSAVVEVERRLQGLYFDFSAFLALSVEEAVDDAIEVHITSWAMVWLFLAVAFPLHCWGHQTFSVFALEAVVGPTVSWLLVCLCVFRQQQASMASAARRAGERDSSSDGETLTTESGHEITRVMSLERVPVVGYALFHGHHLMRCAQIAGLLCSYALSRLAFEPPDWKELWATTASVIVISCLWLVLLFWFYVEAPIFLALMSLPPRISYSTEQHIWHLIQRGGPPGSEPCGEPCPTASSSGPAAGMARFRRAATPSDESTASLTATAASPSAAAPGGFPTDHIVCSGVSRAASSPTLRV